MNSPQASSKFHEEGSHGSPQEASETHTEKCDTNSHNEGEGKDGYDVQLIRETFAVCAYMHISQVIMAGNLQPNSGGE